MDVIINSDFLRALRQERGWSKATSGLSRLKETCDSLLRWHPLANVTQL